ncbi:N-6 DNA methylase [Colwellia sp. E150_009]
MQTKLTVQIDDKKNKIYSPLKNNWFVKTPEEIVRQEYICRLVNNYGFSLEQMKQEVTVSNSSRGQGRAQADIVIWKSKEDKDAENNAIIVVECKAENITIREEDCFQGVNYASWAGAKFVVTTNLKETRIFRLRDKKIPTRLEEIIDIPNAKMVNDDKKIESLLNQTKSFTRDEFSRLLLNCHNVIRNNDKLSPEAAFDEISKILFVKIRYERDNSKTQIFSKDQFLADKESYDRHKSKDSRPFYQQLFESTKEDYKDEDLFSENETIKIRENSFEEIVEKLETYNLSTTSDDIKGIAFEQFLGRTFRGELGQFFTPRTVVDFMVEVLDPEENEVICDPCCGSGGFLIKTFEYIKAKIENEIHLQKEKIKQDYFDDEYFKLPEKSQSKIDSKVNDLFHKLNQELDIKNPKSRLKVLSHDCIFGTDANPRMSRTAKMNMIMHGDGHGGVHHNDGLLNVNGIFENRFDVILTNPPFGSRVDKSLKITEADKYTDENRIKIYKERYGEAYSGALRQVNDNIGEPLLNLFKTGKMSSLTEVLFIERCLDLLKPGGRMGIVLPEGVLNNTNLQKIRDFVESRAKIVLITSIPQDVFIASGATVKPSLLFFKKFTDAETTEWNNITTQADSDITEKYSARTEPLTSKLLLKGKEAPDANEKKSIRKELKDLNTKIAAEVKALVKINFDYQIPIAEVKKAGISTTGSQIENELKPLAEEFLLHRKANKLWENSENSIDYKIDEKEVLHRVISKHSDTNSQKSEIFYQ